MNGTTTGPAVNAPINIYRAPPDENTTGWIVLALILMAAIIVLLCLWAFGASKVCPSDGCNCFGPYGLELNVDAAPINACGVSRNDPCSFVKADLNACVVECDSLGATCPAFTFNPQTSTMKIVQPANTFTSAGTTLYVKQSGDVS